MRFQPQTLRGIQEFVNRTIEKWEMTPADERDEMINPDEPIVLSVPNPEWFEGDEGPYGDGDDGEPRYIHFHVESHGGGGDVDDDGNDCGHEGAAFTGMEIDQNKFLFTGRRREK